MSITSEYTYDLAVPAYVREVIELRQPSLGVLRTSDGQFSYRVDIDENGHVALVSKVVIW